MKYVLEIAYQKLAEVVGILGILGIAFVVGYPSKTATFKRSIFPGFATIHEWMLH